MSRKPREASAEASRKPREASAEASRQYILDVIF